MGLLFSAASSFGVLLGCDPDAPCVGGFSTGLTARSLQLNERERMRNLRVRMDQQSTVERVAVTDRNRDLEISKLLEETETDVPFPTLMCWHLILEKRSPLTSQSVSSLLSHSLLPLI